MRKRSGQEKPNRIGKIRVRSVQEINEQVEKQRGVIGLNNLEVTERNNGVRFGCLARINTTPISMCYGTGSTRYEAEINAIQAAQELLRMIDERGNEILMGEA